MAINDSWVMPVLAVEDLDRASSFYRDKLGLNLRPTPETDSVLVEVGHGYLLLYRSTFRRGETTSMSFMVPDVESTVRDLRSRGVTFEEYDLPGLKTEDGIASSGDVKSAWFKDSEGNVIAITQESAAMMRRAA